MSCAENQYTKRNVEHSSHQKNKLPYGHMTAAQSMPTMGPIVRPSTALTIVPSMPIAVEYLYSSVTHTVELTAEPTVAYTFEPTAEPMAQYCPSYEVNPKYNG